MTRVAQSAWLFCLASSVAAAEIGGRLTNHTIWTSAPPIHVTNNVIVPTNLTLTIEAGALVRLGSNVSIIAQAGGAILVDGTAANPVLFRSLNGTNNWRRISADGKNASLTMRHADIEHGQATVLNRARGSFQSCFFHDYHGTSVPSVYGAAILASDKADSMIVQASHFRNYYETLFRTGVIVIEDSLFENVTGDAIDFDTAAPGSVIRRCTMRHGPVVNADAVDLGSQSAGVLVENCLMYGFPFDKGVSIGEQSSNITVRGCLIYGVDMGVAVKDSSEAVIVNNTIADSNEGLRLYEKIAGQGNGRATAWNNIIWNNAHAITLMDGSTITVTYSDLSGDGVYPGASNFNIDPLFRNPALQDYRLAANSPVARAGLDGATLGALFPVGAFLVDTDGDRLPDTWEMTHDLDFNYSADAAEDTDADGLSNLQEYLAGTNPRISASVLNTDIRIQAGGELLLEFTAAARRSYTIEFRDSFANGLWQKYIDINPVPSEQVWQLSIPATGSARFFRIATSTKN